MFESSFGDGFYEGKAEGINEATKNIAINLAKKGTTIEVIAEVTGLPESDVKHILQKAGE